jgi:adenylate cyclase
MSGDSEQEYFADGMVEEIITALSRIRWLFVIARNSSFTYKGQTIDVKQVGRELGVRYVLEGSVRKAGQRVRITAQLIDATSGTHLWADRFDGPLEDVFELQDKVASSVAGVIEPALQAAETARSAARPTADLTAYDLYLRAYAMALSSATQIHEELRLLEQAIYRDPRYGPARLCRSLLSSASYLRSERTSRGRCAERREFRKAGAGSGRRRPGYPGERRPRTGLFRRGHRGRDSLGRPRADVQPEFWRGLFISGVVRIWAGETDIAIEHIETALRLSPRDRVGMALFSMGQAHFLSRRFDEAVPKLLLAIQEDQSFPLAYRFLAACYAHVGRLGDAREIVERLRAITPGVIHDASFLRNPEHRELYLAGLRIAAGEAI